ncbi:MAG: hypothetical protein RBS48_00380 [Ignavibacteriaceae bacterium]|nr:hypothetical protein [Ignavibacteriaceae bacterium]
MKSILKILLIAVLPLALIGCDDLGNYYDDLAPEPPRNVSIVTGDNRVDILWDHNRESDLAGYNVYYSYSYNGTYKLLGSTKNNSFIDYGAKNGETYYYGVAAYDYNGNESELSYDEVYSTPRPEGFNRVIYDYLKFPNSSGFYFADEEVVAYDSDLSDVFFENYNGTFYLNVWKDSDIQDMGSTYDIYDIKYAPINGWAPLYDGDNVKYEEAKIGHTYVIWTVDNHFAKVRIKQMTQERMVFDWAYQSIEGNRELKREITEKFRPKDGKIKKTYK